ncbi:MAG: hypothetical protein WCB90_07905 [Methanosarcina sp.]|uniref:DUF7502 family protein n=1 Tax=Methanosarcina sp. TaxID=2213 RepID=UPI003BB775AD
MWFEIYMLFESILVKYKNHLKWSYGTLGFLQVACKFTFLFLLLILFNGYEFAYFFPGLRAFIENQAYVEPYWFNIIMMAAGALLITFFVSIACKLLGKKREFNLINKLEGSFPGLRTKLSTAYDNKQNFNIVTKKLFEDVYKQLTDINIKKLAPRNQIFRAFVIFLLFSGAVVYCINQGFSLDIYPSRLIEKVPNFSDRTASGKEEKETVPEIEYNVEAVITKNGEQIEMEINPTLGLGFTNQVEEDTSNEFDGSSNGSNKEFRHSQTYTENLPEEYEPLIKQYFEKLSS